MQSLEKTSRAHVKEYPCIYQIIHGKVLAEKGVPHHLYDHIIRPSTYTFCLKLTNHEHNYNNEYTYYDFIKESH